MTFLLNIIFSFVFICSKVSSEFYSSNTTDLSKCKVHYSRSETAYVEFFDITDNIRGNSSLLVDFHFALLAPRDAHLLFAPSAQLEKSDPVYEIVLGAGRNTFSDIRRLQKSATKQSARTKDLLSPLDVKSFWIHVSKDGLIEIGREGEELAFLSWKDPDPLPLRVFSFCTWPGVEAKWYYDCPREDGSNSESQMIPKNLTNIEKLRNHVLQNYDPYTGPYVGSNVLTTVHMDLLYKRIFLDEFNSKIVVDGSVRLQWLDEFISWNSSEFENKEELHFLFREIWQPDLLIYNSAAGPGDFIKSSYLVVTSEGWVTLHGYSVHIEAWCDAAGLGHWPNDEHTCDIQIGFWSEEENLILNVYHNVSQLENRYSEWTVTDLASGFFSIPTPWNIDLDEYANTFVIKLKVRRTTDMYTAVYFTPLFAIHISLIVSFWLSPFGPHRITLHCVQLIILSLVLTKLATYIPAHPISTPNLVLLYSNGFIASLIALSFSIIMYNLAHTKHTEQLPYFLYKFLSLKYVQVILHVKGSKFSEAYDKLIDENLSSQQIDIQEMWTFLGIAVDRLLFLIYFLLACIFLSEHY